MSERCAGLNCYLSTLIDIVSNTAAVAEVGRGSCYVDQDVERCCHSECLGGCSGSSAADCYACMHVFHEGRCLARCPPGYYQVGELSRLLSTSD